MPIGVMLAGRMGDEATLISLSAQVEAANTPMVLPARTPGRRVRGNRYR